jgi:GWxTD domain-containing protein
MNAASSVHTRFSCRFLSKAILYTLLPVFALTISLSYPDHAAAQQLIQAGEIKTETYRSAAEFLLTVASEADEENFASATMRYLSALERDDFSEKDAELLIYDFRLLQLLNETGLPGVKVSQTNMEAHDIAGEMRRFWIRKDPTPGMIANERLIEHFARVHHARKTYAYEKDVTGLDERGKIYVRYGSPDFTFDQPLHITRADLFEFVSDIEFVLSEAPTTHSVGVFDDDGDTSGEAERISSARSSAQLASVGRTSLEQSYVITEELELAIASNPFTTSVQIWIYDRFEPDMENNLVFYFREEDKDVYSLLPSLDYWIPGSLFTPTRSFRGSYAPALALQFIVYRKLMHLDDQIRRAYSRMERDIFYASVPRSESQVGQMALNHRVRNQQETFLATVNAPTERSEELLKLDDIPLNVYQYRLLNDENEPVFATFIESRPVRGLLRDMARNYERMNLGELVASEEMGNWYRFEVGTELFHDDMKQAGRLRTFPEVMTDEYRDLPSVVLKDVPWLGEGAVQKFYAYLKNEHPESIQSEEKSIFPNELRAAGSVTIEQPAHFETTDGLILSDLLFGAGRLIEDEGLRFPFVVKHDRVIGPNDNPAIHFEVYGLSRGESGFSEFEVEYTFEQESRRSGLFRRGSSTQSGTLHFTSAGIRFAESVEIENLRLRQGGYSLTWKITDLNSGESAQRTIGFRVEE